MKKFYLALAAVAAIFAGCSKEVDNQTEPVVPKEKTVTLKASVSGLETKVSSDNAGFFKWQNQDAITVVTNKDATSFFNLYNIDNTGTQADFEGAIADGDALKYALYPASNSHTPDGKELLFNIDDIVTWKADACNMPMLGVATSASTVNFVALGGVLKLVLFNIPADADYLKFSATSKQISGTFYIEDVTVEAPVIATAPKEEGDNIQVIDFSENYSSSKVFYIPLPTGDIDGFTVALYEALDKEPLFSVTSEKTLNVVANKLIIAKSMNCSGASTLWSEDFSDYSANDVPAGGTYSYSCEDGSSATKVFNEHLAGGSAPELLVGKSGGSFTAANVPTNSAGTLTLKYKTNANALTLSSADEGVEFSPASTNTADEHTITVTNSDNLSFISITFAAGSKNVRLDDIVLSIEGQEITNAPVINTDVDELTFAIGESSKNVTVNFANAIDDLGVSAILGGDNASNFTAALNGTTLTVTAKAPNSTAANYTATVTLRASGAAAKTISITQESAVVPNLTNLEATPGDSSAEVTWAGSEHATSYVAYLHTSETETPATGGNDVSSSINGCALSLASLINDQTYYLYVKVDGVETGYVAPGDFVMVSFTPSSSDGKIYYEKVTTALADWSGEYLLVCESEYKALAEISTTSTKYGLGADVTIDNGAIESTATTDAYKIVIAPATGEGAGYTLAFGDGYLNWSSGNSLSTNAAETDNTRWTIAAGATSGNWVIKNVSDSAREIWYNTGNPRFACYTGKDESTTGYAPVQLYKLADNREDPGMSWSAEAATATYNTGNTLSFTAPTLTLGNASNISFASTDETIATITATGAVNIEALVGNEVKEGSTTIKAIFAGDDNYKPQTVSYTLNVVDNRDAVAAPTFSPAAGEVEAGDEVTINSVSGATVYYTVNGSNPTTESTLYEGPITIDEAKTIKAIAVLSGYKPSAVAEAAYTVAGVQANDGSLEHPYTADEAYTQILAGNESTVYVTGTVVSVGSLSNGVLTYWISEDGTTTNQIQVYKGKYLGNVNFSSADQLASGDNVLVYGPLKYYNNTTPEINSGSQLISINGKTKVLTAGTLTATPDNDNKQITVDWGAASGTESAISYVVTCGTQSYNADAAGSHTFTMADYGSYQVSVTASADDAISVTASTSATLTDPSAGTTDKSATIKFGSANGSTAVNSTSVTGDDSQGNTWTITTVTNNASFTQNASYSQIGSSNKPATSITFTTTLSKSATIKAFSAKFGGFNGTAGTVTLKVDNTTVGSGSLNGSSDVTVSATDNTAVGTVLTVTVTGISKGVKAYEINVTYNN